MKERGEKGGGGGACFAGQCRTMCIVHVRSFPDVFAETLLLYFLFSFVVPVCVARRLLRRRESKFAYASYYKSTSEGKKLSLCSV